MKSLFPQLEKPKDLASLVGLKITKVISSWKDEISVIQCESMDGESHELVFCRLDESCLELVMDGEKVGLIPTGD